MLCPCQVMIYYFLGSMVNFLLLSRLVIDNTETCVGNTGHKDSNNDAGIASPIQCHVMPPILQEQPCLSCILSSLPINAIIRNLSQITYKRKGKVLS